MWKSIIDETRSVESMINFHHWTRPWIYTLRLLCCCSYSSVTWFSDVPSWVTWLSDVPSWVTWSSDVPSWVTWFAAVPPPSPSWASPFSRRKEPLPFGTICGVTVAGTCEPCTEAAQWRTAPNGSPTSGSERGPSSGAGRADSTRRSEGRLENCGPWGCWIWVEKEESGIVIKRMSFWLVSWAVRHSGATDGVQLNCRYLLFHCVNMSSVLHSDVFCCAWAVRCWNMLGLW